jgi:hypothetical protein
LGLKLTRRLLRRKAQRGNAVLVVVLATMMLSAVGVYAVRSISIVDRAVGYGRQAAQTTALAELGATTAMAYVANSNRDSLTITANNTQLKCVANANPPPTQAVTCYPFRGADMETVALAAGGETLLEPAAGAETGSLGAASDMRGLVDVELTDISQAQIYLAGRDLTDKPLDATVTTRARIIPNQASGAPCGAAVSSMTAKKLMRAHAIF